MNEQKSVVLFGLTGDGKSSVANMLIQGDIHRDGNLFAINDTATGVTVQMTYSLGEEFEVYDTVGLGEGEKGRIPHKEAVKTIRDYFSRHEVPLNYIAYVKKRGRITEEDRKMFKLFKRIFEGGERNFIIIITNAKPEWVDQNLKDVQTNFGDYPVIPVDFPREEGDDDDDDVVGKRKQSLQRLKTALSRLSYHHVRLEVLNSSQSIENRISNGLSFVPVIGTLYYLISSGVYQAIGKPMMATDRFLKYSFGIRGRITYRAIERRKRLRREMYI